MSKQHFRVQGQDNGALDKACHDVQPMLNETLLIYQHYTIWTTTPMSPKAYKLLGFVDQCVCQMLMIFSFTK